MQVLLLHRDQAQLMMRMSELKEMASRDEMTGLHNRRHFYEVAEQELAVAQARRDTLAILVLDLDGLKAINDEHGHGVGDIVITKLAQVITKHIRTTDVAARLGGDEFGVVMQGTDKRGAFALARRLWEEMERSPIYEDGETRLMVTVSIGVAGYPWGGDTLDEMLHWADADMYANKVSRRLPEQPQQLQQELEDTGTLIDDYVLGN
jgi:diguanylate cyclase (GGDEF)-like protein